MLNVIEIRRDLVLHFSITPVISVAEVADSSEEHGQAEAVGGFDHLGIPLRASGLDDCGGPSFGDFFDPVGKGKTSEAATVPLRGSWAFMAPIFSQSTRDIWPAPDAYGLSVKSTDDDPQLDVFADFPKQRAGLPTLPEWADAC